MKRVLASVLLLSSAAFACNAILGNEEGQVVVSAVDGSVRVDSSVADDAATPPDAAEPVCGNADLLHDKENCGRCGFSCQGAECSDGRCVPLRLLEKKAGDVLAVTIAEQSVYLVGRIGVWTVPLAGGEAKELRPSVAPGIARDVMVIGKRLYYVEQGTVEPGLWTCDLPECSSPTRLNTAAQLVQVSADERDVYWIEPNELWRKTADGGVPISKSLPNARVALWQDELYFSSVTSQNAVRLWKADRDGENARSLYDGGSPGSSSGATIAVNGERVYMAAHSLVSMNHDGSDSIAYAELGVTTSSLQLNKSHIYWLAGLGALTNAIRRCPLSRTEKSCTPETLPAQDPVDFAVSDSVLIWFDANGRLMKLAI